ncbi:pseudo histidine-containing phosphotransfer protein 5-like isoform X1 [Humulus lupulus]|uniref:pseudo histidine-containing phosphotransfer protein 5-like isoform X1 n=1 Tax=Humulus lupulus TaxID=3486 RepID=UPI002B40E465|nr:pseudo histidine-containing phosphotransfer protein 5-like isoform X1 [Humulus lupulus]
MESSPLRQQIATMRQSLFDEKMLDEHYLIVEQLEDENNPNFAEEIMTMYFRDSTQLIANLEQALEKPTYDFIVTEKHLHKLLGSSGSIGANQVSIEVNQMRKCTREHDIERMKTTLQQVKKEHEKLRGRIEPYFQLLRQVGPVETAQRPS